ncbi:MAG: MBL fold metallo-hydrolase [Anaerolineae bacterium]|nr:MBL fold metallo-hydrolase [Anaerolineae bacterium]
MYWERVSEDIFLFTSDRYALVNSVAILTDRGTVVVDALPFPDEARQIARFLEIRSGMDFYALILTHHHMDHVYGLYAFPEHLDVISSKLCRDRLLEIGESSLAQARESDPTFEEVHLRLPTIIFDTGEFFVDAGNKTFKLFSLPGHTPDNIGVYIEEEEVLITGDAVMAIPIVADGDWEQEIKTLQFIKELQPDTVIQGHGEVILRGEIDVVMDLYIDYLRCVREQAEQILRRGRDRKEIWEIPLEKCGLERVPLGIASHQLHVANIMSVYDKLKAEQDG